MSYQVIILIVAMTALAHFSNGSHCDKCDIESHNKTRVCSKEGKQFRLCEAECDNAIEISCYLPDDGIDVDDENCVCPPCPNDDDPVCVGDVRYKNKCEAVKSGSINWCKINESPGCLC